MAKYYHFDVVRWEGEGGASDETPASSTAARLVDVRGRQKPSTAFLQILSGIVVLASVAFARRKGWI